MITRKHFYPAVLASAIVASFYVKAGACATTADGETLQYHHHYSQQPAPGSVAKTEGFSTKHKYHGNSGLKAVFKKSPSS